jgi:hypothetical protein
MNDQQITHALGRLAEKLAPDGVDLWPAIRDHFEMSKNFSSQGDFSMNPNLVRKRGRSVVYAALFVLAFLAVAVFVLPQGRALAQDILKTIRLGPDTSVSQTGSGVLPPKPAPMHGWSINTDIGAFGGNSRPGETVRVLSFSTIADAETRVQTPIPQPAFLPAGYALKEVKIVPDPAGWFIFQTYSGPGHDLIVAQMPGSTLPEKSQTTKSLAQNGIVTSGSLEQVDLDGKTAAWINANTLVWTNADLTYEVGGLDLDLEQAKAIARSIRTR